MSLLETMEEILSSINLNFYPLFSNPHSLQFVVMLTALSIALFSWQRWPIVRQQTCRSPPRLRLDARVLATEAQEVSPRRVTG
jgi:hypothetical protein